MEPRKARKKGRRTLAQKKFRFHISLTKPMATVADFLGCELFGSRNGFIEHALINALDRQGITVEKILELAKKYEEEQLSKEQSTDGETAG